MQQPSDGGARPMCSPLVARSHDALYISWMRLRAFLSRRPGANAYAGIPRERASMARSNHRVL